MRQKNVPEGDNEMSRSHLTRFDLEGDSEKDGKEGDGKYSPTKRTLTNFLVFRLILSTRNISSISACLASCNLSSSNLFVLCSGVSFGGGAMRIVKGSLSGTTIVEFVPVPSDLVD